MLLPLLSSTDLTPGESEGLLTPMKAILFLLFLLLGTAAGPDEDPFPGILGGGPLVVEVAPLVAIGRDLPTPPGWGFHQAVEADDALFREIAGSDFSTGLLYFDGAGNLLLVDGEEGASRRIVRRCKEAEEFQKTRDQNINEAWQLAIKKQDSGDRPGEVRYLVALAGSLVRGNDLVVAARSRLRLLERIALEEFWQLMASEGSVSNSTLVKELRKLEKTDAGLQISTAVTRERMRIEAGISVKGDSR